LAYILIDARDYEVKRLEIDRVAKKMRARGHYPRGRFTIGEVSEEDLV
jgi:hypothetical protein